MNTDAQKFAAIKYLLQNCKTHNEWSESALLNQVSTVMFNDTQDLSKETLDKMIDESENS